MFVRFVPVLSNMEWSRSSSLKLIRLYKQHECLWNPADDDYKNKGKKNDAWNNLCEIFQCDLIEMKKKMDSLLGSFRRERQKQTNAAKTNFGADTNYQSKWFAFNDMLFLLDKFEHRELHHVKIESEDSFGSYEFKYVEDEENEAELDSTQQPESTDTQLTTPKVSEVSIPKRKLDNQSTNSSIAPSKKRVPESRASTSSEDAFQLMNTATVANPSLRDSSTIYGEYVASKHRKYSSHTQCVIENLIANILYNADMGKYEPATGDTSLLP